MLQRHEEGAAPCAAGGIDLAPATGPRPRTIGEAIRANAERAPDRAFVFQDLAGGETFVDYAALDHLTAGRARLLHARGVRCEQRVAVVAREPGPFVVNFLAALRLGAVPVPLYAPAAVATESLNRRSAAIMAAAGVSVLITPERFAADLALGDAIDVLTEESLDTAGADASGEAVALDAAAPEDVAYLQFTSGSTANPRAVVLTHAALAANAESIRRRLRVDPRTDCGVSWLPLGHDMGLVGFVIAPILWGGPTCLLLPTARFIRRPAAWMNAVHAHRGTITFAPPYALTTLCRAARPAHLDEWDLSCLRVVGVGAEPINPGHLRLFVETLAQRCALAPEVVTPAYGLAEATLAVAMKAGDQPYRVRRVDAVAFRATGVARAAPRDEPATLHISCGPPVPGMTLCIVDDVGRTLADGREGRIRVSGESVCRVVDTEADRQVPVFTDGWLETGDLGYLRDGELYVTGRRKNLIVVHGVNHHPESIEWVICENTGFVPGSVVAFSRPGTRTEELVVVAEHRAAPDPHTAGLVGECIERHFALALEDLRFVPPGTLLRTPSGKLRRGEIRAAYLDGIADGGGS